MTGETTLRLDGRTAVVTGAAGLIGSALAAGFAANGADVVLVDRDAGGLARVAESIESKTTQLTCDITDPDAVQRLADTVVERFGHVDVLINNAGGNRRVHPHEVSEEDWTYVTDSTCTARFWSLKPGWP